MKSMFTTHTACLIIELHKTFAKIQDARSLCKINVNLRRFGMKKQSSAPTMKDVAREAGVALGTVSKVVNGLPVGDSYRIRVEEAIRKLNYQVNSYAQGLKAGKTCTAALLIPNTIDPFFASVA